MLQSQLDGSRRRAHSHSGDGLRHCHCGEAVDDPIAVADVDRKLAVVGREALRKKRKKYAMALCDIAASMRTDATD
jgi:hypothetical protein